MLSIESRFRDVDEKSQQDTQCHEDYVKHPEEVSIVSILFTADFFSIFHQQMTGHPSDKI